MYCFMVLTFDYFTPPISFEITRETRAADTEPYRDYTFELLYPDPGMKMQFNF
jgi:hypothetical protein